MRLKKFRMNKERPLIKHYVIEIFDIDLNVLDHNSITPLVREFTKKLKLKNIRSYEEEIINIPEGLCLLSGNIGSGKSNSVAKVVDDREVLYFMQLEEPPGLSLAYSAAGRYQSACHDLSQGLLHVL